MKRTFEDRSFSYVCKKMMTIALGVSDIVGYSPVVSDMVYAMYELHKKELDSLPFYVAVREQGVESGDRESVIERCAALGEPLITACITKGSAGFDISIKTLECVADIDLQFEF